MSVIFGRRTQAGDDPDVEALFRTINHLRQPPGKWLVNNWTQLENLPKWMQWWRPYGEAMYEDTISTYRKLYTSFKEEQEKGIQKDCFAKKFFPVADDLGFSKDQQMFVIGTLIEAATDTTRNSNHVLIAHAAHDPSWTKAVREQLDEVCGHNAERLPDYDDWDKLPHSCDYQRKLAYLPQYSTNRSPTCAVSRRWIRRIPIPSRNSFHQ